MKKPKTYLSCDRYRSFIEARDRTLEVLLRNAKMDSSRFLHRAMEQAIGIITIRYPQIAEFGNMTARSRAELLALEGALTAVFESSSAGILASWSRMRRSARMLATLGEFEAIGRARGRTRPIEYTAFSHEDLVDGTMKNGESIQARTALGLRRLARKCIDAVELSLVMGDDLGATIERVKSKLPKAVVYRRPDRQLRPFREAARSSDEREARENVKRLKTNSVTLAMIDDGEWNEFLDAYKSTYLPATRFMNEPVRFTPAQQRRVDVASEWIKPDQDVEEWYAWEVEQVLTEDFVEQVRNGQREAYRAAGVRDFVWIAILDERTDVCCSWRNGLTVTEIRAELNGKHSDDESQAVVPPAHEKCRCTLAPVGDVPERIELDLGEFSEWLMAS